jgi:hypothetical protein
LAWWLCGIEIVAVCSRSEQTRVGRIVVAEFRRRLDRMQGSYWFCDREITAAELRECALILFRLTRMAYKSPDERRKEVMKRLQICVEPSSWSKGLEHDFVALIADVLLEGESAMAQ